MWQGTLFFGHPYHLSTKNQQLICTHKETGEQHTRPIEDLGFVVLDHPQLTFTQSVFQLLAKHNVGVIFCEPTQHYPCSMLLHLDTHTLQNERVRYQTSASVPLKKQLWQQIIQAKIHMQSHVLTLVGQDPAPLRACRVKSGDATGQEAQAARYYWPRLFGNKFRRERHGMPPNPALNYGYAILRAATARALAGTGLLPVLGLHHKNKYNPFALADDVMEPYRPVVDLQVHHILSQDIDCDHLQKSAKQQLLQILQVDILMDQQKSPLLAALQHTAVSLAKCYMQQKKRICYPDTLCQS